MHQVQRQFDGTWVLDRENGVARLKNPSEHLKNYTVKLQPMLGCIAVAPPAHQSLRTMLPAQGLELLGLGHDGFQPSVSFCAISLTKTSKFRFVPGI